MYHRDPHPIQNLENPTVLSKKHDYFLTERGTKKQSTCFLQINLPKHGAVVQFINSPVHSGKSQCVLPLWLALMFT